MTKPTITKNKDGTVACTVIFDEKQVQKAEEAVLKEMSKSVKIKGFRPGKAPADKVREKIDEAQLTENTIRHLLPATLESLTKENDIVPIIHPNVELTAKEPLTVQITFTTMPEAKLKGISKIKVDKKAVKVDKKEVDRMVDYILKQHEETKTVKHAAKKGDRVTMDFYGEDEDGNEIENTRSKDYAAIIGGQTLIPGFEDELIGLKAGDKKSFEITFPKNYQAEHLRNKKATFHVEAKKVEEVKLPKLTDDFAKKVLKTDSKKAFLDEIEASMKKQEEDVEAKRREGELLEKITDATSVELPDTLIIEETKQMISEFEQQLAQQGMNLEQWMQATQKDPKDVMENFKTNAKRRITLRLGMQELVKEKDVKIKDTEVEAAVERVLTNAGKDAKELKKQYQEGKPAYEQLLWQLKVEKIMAEMLAH